MAKVRFSLTCGVFCLCSCYFLCFIGLANARIDSLNDFYDASSLYSHHTVSHSLHLELLKENEFRPKRDVESLPAASSSTPVVPVNISEKVKPWILQNDTSSIPPDYFKQWHNLGVNGTGQRRNIPIIREQPDLLHNGGPPVNTPVKTSSEEADSDEDESLVPSDVLTPDEVSVEDGVDKKYLEDHNITNVKTDHHIFYYSTMFNDPQKGQFYWVDMEKQKNVNVNELLSNSHRRAGTVKLSFAFPFYGRYIENVTVATGGFLYTGHFVHSWLAATQYIAPLMANFDTNLSANSFVKHVDNGTAFTVEWDRVPLQDQPGSEFTFQVTLHKDGDIIFVYKNISIPVENITDHSHPVKVGLSDAYISDRTAYYVRKKTIYEYHRVAFNKGDIKNWTVIYLKPLPTCLDMYNCSSCMNNDLGLFCTWCPALNQCSTGKDRHRQLWVDKGCESRNVTLEANCAKQSDQVETIDENETHYDVNEAKKYDADIDYIGGVPRRSQRELGPSGYVAIVFLVAMVIGFGFWTAYAYKNPHTTSGQMLIRYRPSQWRWRRGEARYTAATIHM